MKEIIPKQTVKFSISLLKMNRKHHKERISKIKGYTSSIQYMKKELKSHQKFYDDLTEAINILSGK